VHILIIFILRSRSEIQPRAASCQWERSSLPENSPFMVKMASWEVLYGFYKSSINSHDLLIISRLYTSTKMCLRLLEVCSTRIWILLFSKDAFNWSKLTVKSFILLLKCCKTTPNTVYNSGMVSPGHTKLTLKN